MPLAEDGSLLDQTPMNTQTADISQTAPPLYGEHVLDQLYDGIDRSGYMTPGGVSGVNTPFYSQSRTGSAENLSSLNGVANTAVPPSALTARLQNLNLSSRNSSFRRRNPGNGSGGNTPLPYPGEYNEGHLSNAHSSTASMQGLSTSAASRPQSGYFDLHRSGHSPVNPLSRRGSTEEEHPDSGLASGLTSGQRSPEHLDFADLRKVPSYETALKTPLRGLSYSENLPDYDTAISRPSSPVNGVGNSYFPPMSGPSTPGPSTPGPEMGGPQASGDSSSLSSSTTSSRRGPLSHLGFGHSHHDRHHSGHDEREPHRRSHSHLLKPWERAH
jgi:hypothetical protein